MAHSRFLPPERILLDRAEVFPGYLYPVVVQDNIGLEVGMVLQFFLWAEIKSGCDLIYVEGGLAFLSVQDKSSYTAVVLKCLLLWAYKPIYCVYIKAYYSRTSN